MTTIQRAAPLSSRFITPRASVPSGPTQVQLSVVSRTSLGVHWSAPATDGGSKVLGFLVEWEPDRTFTRALSSTLHSSSYLDTGDTAYSELVNASVAGDCGGRSTCLVEFASGRLELFDPVDYQLQITNLREEQYNVRVSAFNALGYSRSVITSPAAATPSDRPL